MFKVFAILAVLAAFPMSALAEQVPLTKNAGIHCAKDAADQAYLAPASQGINANVQSAQVAR